MSLLPDVERELARAARNPARRAGRLRRGPLAAVAVAAIALVLGGVFVLVPARHTTTAPHSHPSTGAFPGAPRTQRSLNVASGTCRLAAPNRYLPRRVGCVSVMRANVDGDGRTDLVLLYARLGRHSFDGRYAPTGGFTLEVVPSSGRTLHIHASPSFRRSVFGQVLVAAANVNGLPGDELFVETGAISSGSYYALYTVHAGRLHRVDIVLQAGGDSGTQQGFSCRTGRSPLLVQRVMNFIGPNEFHGRWGWTKTTYAWRGATLHRVRRRSFVRRGLPSRTAASPGRSCGFDSAARG